LPYRLANSAKEGRAHLEADNFIVPVDEFGDDFSNIYSRASDEAIKGKYPKSWDSEDASMLVSKTRRDMLPSPGDTQGTVNLRKTSKVSAPPVADDFAENLRSNSETLETTENLFRNFSDEANARASTMENKTVERAKTLLDQMRQADATAAQNASMKEGLDAAAGPAREKLGNIKTGRAIMDMGSPFNMAQAALGIPGKGTGNIVQKMIDFGGAQGQRMAKAATLAEQWSTRDDNLGRLAKWALSGNPETTMARMAILADMPEAQDEVGIE
jgi:hypothetical protein